MATTGVGVVLVVAGKDLRQRLRDRSAIVVGLVAPFMLAFIISAALGGAIGRFHATVVVADEDHGVLARAFVDNVLRSPALRRVIAVRVAATPGDAVAQVGHNDAAAAYVIPAGFTAAALAGQPAELQVVTGAQNLIAGQVAGDIARGFAAAIQADRLAVDTALAARSPGTLSPPRVDPTVMATLVARARALPSALRLDTFGGGRQAKPAAYFGPAMAMFFLFFTVGLGSRSFLAERNSGTLARLLAAPVSPSSLLAGKALATLAIGLASMLVLVATSSALGASWGSIPAVLILVLAIVVAAMAITSVVATLARTEEQVGGWTSIVSIVLALLGGNFIPIAQAPDLLRRLRLITPNGWALRAFADLGAGAGLRTVVPSLVAVTAFAAVTGALAVARAGRLVRA